MIDQDDQDDPAELCTMATGDGDLAAEIEASAEGPKHVAVDGLAVDQHPLKDMIDADRYLASKANATKRKRGLNLAKLSPPGTA